MESASSSARPSSKRACLLCRTRKLRCDRNPRTCSNCQRAKEPCIAIDPISNRPYKREYLDDLEARAVNLREVIHESSLQTDCHRVQLQQTSLDTASIEGSASETVPDQARNSNPNSDGSIFSLGHLVAAAVSMQFPNGVTFRSKYSHPRNGKQYNTESIQATYEELPTLSIAQELVASYFDNGFHKVSPFLRRGQVYEQLIRLYGDSAETSRPEKRNDMYQIFMIFAIGSMFLRTTRHLIPPINYYTTAMQYSDTLYESAGDIQIQNTLLLIIFAHQHDVGIGSKWKLARQAMHICVQRGYHKEPVLPQEPIQEQVERRLFWCCYVQERFASCNLGRPIAISDADITVDLPSDICLDGLNVTDFGNSSVKSEVSVLKRQVCLRRITTKVRAELYTRHEGASRNFISKEVAANMLNEELENWRASYCEDSTDAHSSCIFETKEYMDINFHRERVSIFFGLAVPTGSESQAFEPAINYLRYCLESSVEIIALYQMLSAKNILVTNWTYVQDILRSGFMILYCGIHIPRIVSHKTGYHLQGCQEVQSIITGMDECRQMLKDIARQWKTVNLHRIAYDRLSDEAKRLIEMMTSLPSTEDQVGNGFDSSHDMEGQLPLDLNFSDIPFDITAWENLIQEDVDMREVFGFDTNGGIANWTWET